MKRIPPEIIVHLQDERSQGKSIPELSRSFNLAKSSVQRYIKNVYILPEYRVKWELKRKGALARKSKFEEMAKEQAEQMITSMNEKECLLFFCALYWAEGNKKVKKLVSLNMECAEFVY